MARNVDRHKRAAHVLYHFFIHRKVVPIEAVSDLAQVSIDTVYAYANNRQSMPIDFIAPLVRALRQLGVVEAEVTALVSDLIAVDGLTVSSSAQPEGSTCVQRQALRATAASGRVAQTVAAALDDQKIDHAEAVSIRRAVEESQREHETLGEAAEKAAVN